MAFTIQVISRPQRTRLFRDPLGIDNECISVFVPCRQYFWKCGLPNCSLTQFFLCQPSCYTWAKVILKISGNMTEKREKWVHASPNGITAMRTGAAPAKILCRFTDSVSISSTRLQQLSPLLYLEIQFKDGRWRRGLKQERNGFIDKC